VSAIIFDTEVKFNNKYSRVDSVYIDMTNWKTLEKSQQAEDIFPYRIVFKDAAGNLCKAHATEMKSGGLDNMLKEAKKHNIIITDDTNVTVICPKDQLALDTKFGCSCKITVRDLRTKGMKAVPFTVTDEGKVSDRFESALDSIVHHGCESYIDAPRMRSKDGVFKRSIYHYEKADLVHAQLVTMHPEVDTREYNDVCAPF